MNSAANVTTIDPRFLQLHDATHQAAQVPNGSEPIAYSTGLETINWEGGDKLDRLVYCVLEAQDKLRRLPPDVAKKLGDHVEGFWSTIDSRVVEVLWTRDFSRSDCEDIYIPPSDTTAVLEPESDVDEEDRVFFTTLYDDIRAFHEAKSREFYVVRPLATQQRRHTHAIAHFMNYGHLSVGTGKFRQILLSRKQAAIPAEAKAMYKDARSKCISRCACIQKLSQSERVDHSITERLGTYATPSANGYGYHNSFAAADYSSVGSSASASSHVSHGSGISNTPGRRGKRKREFSAFDCTHPGCGERFDRWCDQNHHYRVHLPYEQRPYPCEQCDKRFLFPKDLKRHQSTHLPGERGRATDEPAYLYDSMAGLREGDVESRNPPCVTALIPDQHRR